jgi:hypothetical protein
VLRLRDELDMPFAKIAQQLDVDVRTFRAYDAGHPELAVGHSADGRITRDLKRRRLSAASVVLAEEMIRSGRPTSEIAKKVNCSDRTVDRIRRRINVRAGLVTNCFRGVGAAVAKSS